MMSDDSSELSSAPSDLESDIEPPKKEGILKFFSKASAKKAAPAIEDSPPPPPREPSPPHEYVLADNPDIAFIVMFRSRFNEAFPKSLPNFGPQELERGVIDTVPGENVEQLLCALLSLLLNRKQDVKSGHYNRALEEAVQTHKSQWAKGWESKNPLSGGATFTSMSPSQRLTLLRTLILWSLSSSDVIKGIIAASYKQTRHEDDLNQPLSVPPWGTDSYKRRYYLIEGLDDTHFRIYKESSGIKRTWYSVAGDIEELKLLADKLSKDDGGQKARLLAGKMRNAIPRFEATEEKRKRREYRQIRKQQFKRPETNFSMYEGRTRGKRMKYTYSDDEDDFYSDSTSRRSTRNTGTHTPADTGPVITASGRQVRPRHGGAYGESMLTDAQPQAISVGGYDGIGETPEGADSSLGRSRRAAVAKGGHHIEGYNSVDELDDEDDASEQDFGDDDDEDDHVPLESDEEPDDFSDDDVADDEMDIDTDAQDSKSLVIKLPLKTPTPERKPSHKLELSPSESAAESKSHPVDSINDTKVEDDGELNAPSHIDDTAPISTNTTSSTSDQAIPGSISLPSAPEGGESQHVTSAAPFRLEAREESTATSVPTVGGSVDQALPGSVSVPAASVEVKEDDVIPNTTARKHDARAEAPLSPPLTYRESPGQAQTYAAPINVGQSGP